MDGISTNSFSLFILYLVISGNFLAPLFSCQLQHFIEDTMFFRHILGFLTMTFFVVLANRTNPMTYRGVLSLSGVLYIWFLLSTRMSLRFWTLFILLIGAVYMIHLYQSDLTSDTPTKEEAEKLDETKLILTATAGLVTVVGFLSYLGEKHIEFGSKFKFEQFILGAPRCRRESPSVGFIESMRALFRP
jgi:hypothetical protein